MKAIKLPTVRALALACAMPLLQAAETNLTTKATTNVTDWITRPISMGEAIDLALQQNGTILKGKSDLEAAYGVVVQTRAIAIPKLQANGQYAWTDAIDKFQFPNTSFSLGHDQSWNIGVRVVQSIYEGGRVMSSLRASRLTRQQAILQYQAVVADTLLEVRVAYDDVLLAAQQIVVQEASVKLLSQELQDTTRRFDAGTVPRFNVLRAEVELANARPKLIHSKNSYRVSKNLLANLLGFHVPKETWDDLPLQLSGRLEEEPYDVELPIAVARAIENRPELGALRKAEGLRKEDVVGAKSGTKPSVQLFAGYGARNSSFTEDLSRDVYGWDAGVMFTWSIFDGMMTRGKVQQAQALYEKAHVEVDDTTRRVELEVRTAYSNFIEAKEVLESQKKVQEQAEEALRLATSRYDAGTGTQLDVLNAQTSLTEARTTQIQALHDYAVARARLERAIGEGIFKEADVPPKP